MTCRLDPSYRHSAESSKPMPVVVYEISLLLIGMRDSHLSYLNYFARMHGLSVVSLLLLLENGACHLGCQLDPVALL